MVLKYVNYYSQYIAYHLYMRPYLYSFEVPDLLGENCAHSLSLAIPSSSKLFLEANPDLLEVSCTQIQAPIHFS